jgi:hypothetical protein
LENQGGGCFGIKISHVIALNYVLWAKFDLDNNFDECNKMKI